MKENVNRGDYANERKRDKRESVTSFATPNCENPVALSNTHGTDGPRLAAVNTRSAFWERLPVPSPCPRRSLMGSIKVQNVKPSWVALRKLTAQDVAQKYPMIAQVWKSSPSLEVFIRIRLRELPMWRTIRDPWKCARREGKQV